MLVNGISQPKLNPDRPGTQLRFLSALIDGQERLQRACSLDIHAAWHAACVLTSICYHKVNEVNCQRADAGVTATAHYRRAIFFAGPCSLYYVRCMRGHRRATRARTRPFW
jgi:hypothetical protein